MLGNFSIGDYFKQGAVEMAWEFSLEHLGFDPERIWITVFEGDDELGLGPDEEAIEAWLSVGRPARADRRAAALGELLAGGPDRPVRAVLGALLRPRARVRHRGRPPGRRQRALPGVLEPRLHAVRPGARGRPDAAAGAEHRHRARARARWRCSSRAPTRSTRPTSSCPLIELGERAERRALPAGRRHRPRAADPRRPHARACRS